jgi:hypothetical protein
MYPWRLIKLINLHLVLIDSVVSLSLDSLLVHMCVKVKPAR